jgi:hypothetical protein
MAEADTLLGAGQVDWAQPLPGIAGAWAQAAEDRGIPARAVLLSKPGKHEVRRTGAKPLRVCYR